MLGDVKFSACWDTTQPYHGFCLYFFYLIVGFVLAFAFAFNFMITFILAVYFEVCFCLNSIDANEERTTKEGNSSPKELHKLREECNQCIYSLSFSFSPFVSFSIYLCCML